MASASTAVPNKAYDAPGSVTGSSDIIHGVQENNYHDDDDAERQSDTSSTHKQGGVEAVEALTTVWSDKTMLTLFILLWLVAFIDDLLQAVQGSVSPYVTSTFNEHGLLGVTGIVATILGGVCNLAIAKVIDIWGRCEGFIVMIFLVIIGMVMKAACINIEMYAAANTIYWVGHIGVGYVITILFADMTTLRNRLILFGLKGTPIICSVFAGPKIADLFVHHSNFRWAFGAFCIIYVFFAIPVIVVFILSKRKGVREGKFPKKIKTRTYWESTKFYFVEFDVVGMACTTFGFCLLLLSFSLAPKAPNGWKTGYIIAMIVLGVVFIAAFVVWEKYFAKVQYFPFKYLKDRTILASSLLYGFMFMSIFVWDTYYSSYLQVVHDLSITNAGYVLNTFSLTSAIIGPLVGVAIRYIGTFKYFSIGTTPFAILGTALLLKFRTPGSHVGYLVMCQLFNGVYSGVWSLTAQLAIMAVVGHQELAVAIALYGLFGSIGASIGNALAAALWNNILPVELYKNLPDDAKNLTQTIFGNINVQLSYPMGSPIREATIQAYGHVQRLMVITGVCFIPVCVACLFAWKNINVIKVDAARKKSGSNVF
ncbi:hypothetical protein K4F52_001684 [Lecanicillium sp. MT-2017a]|nr:hypothetical protein K4F52_001684 [Lecanicillium sp. MT-2017a]